MPPATKAAPQQPAQPKRSLLSKALTKGDPASLTKDDILDVVFWFRCLTSLIFGLVAGCLGLTGYPVILGYGASMLVLSYTYTGKYLQIDEDDFNPQELMMEGVGNAIGLFLLSWILCYTFI